MHRTAAGHGPAQRDSVPILGDILCVAVPECDSGGHRRETGRSASTLTDTGTFHVERLQLNRPPLVALRRTRYEVASLRHALKTAGDEQARLQRQIARLERETEEVLAQLSRLSGRSL